MRVGLRQESDLVGPWRSGKDVMGVIVLAAGRTRGIGGMIMGWRG